MQRWLDEPPTPRSVEFEAMLKVFFADAGTLDQLQATIDAMESEAAGRLRELATMSGQNLTGATGFPGRLHISALALRLQWEQEDAVLRWARWARTQLKAWRGTDDPGEWDARAVLHELIERSDRTAVSRLAPDVRPSK